MGRCVCLREKLALADLFLIIVDLLQRTNGYELALPDGPGTVNLNLDPYKTCFIVLSVKIFILNVVFKLFKNHI